jgi:hypothetical protein
LGWRREAGELARANDAHLFLLESAR